VGFIIAGGGGRTLSARSPSAAAPPTIATTNHVPGFIPTVVPHGMRKRKRPPLARKKRLHGGGLKPCSLAEEENEVWKQLR
jgi:hypothetical protein